jgi:HEPN domain-containing protein
MSLSYSSKAKLFWREAEKYFKQFRYPESACFYGESIEFATKAICMFLGSTPARKHDISKNLTQLSGRTEFSKYKKQICRAIWISSRWVGMAQRARELMRYGNPDAKMSAAEIISKKDVEPLKRDAEEICKLLCQVEFERKFKPSIKLGILNGYVDNSNGLENPCSEFPFNEFKDISIWRKSFSEIVSQGKNKYDIKEISVSEVNNEFAVIINPFGEAYPEKDTATRLAFNILKDYVADGGILVNTAGFPFFYAWNVGGKGKEALQPVVDEKIFMPLAVKLEEGKVTGVQYRIGLGFAGSLFWKEFGGVTTVDTDKLSGVNEIEVKQTEEDKKISGDLINIAGSNKVSEFRALRKETRNLIPLLRAERPDFGEVYPIAAVRYGWGCLITCGMHTKSSAEFERLISAIDNFCNWAAQNTH